MIGQSRPGLPAWRTGPASGVLPAESPLAALSPGRCEKNACQPQRIALSFIQNNAEIREAPGKVMIGLKAKGRHIFFI
jgi:hypothetical protein